MTATRGFVLAFLVAGVWSQNLWVGVVAGLVAAALVTWWFPNTKCWWCGPRGGPRRMDGSGQFWHNCFVCRGSGKRKRLGAMIWGGVDD